MKIKILDKEDWLNALVSKEVDFKLTAYGHHRDMKPTQVGPRVIYDHHISFYSKGDYNCTIKDQSYFIKPGSLLWIQPGIKQLFKPKEKNQISSSYWLRFFLGNNNEAYKLSEHVILNKHLNGIPGLFNEILPIITIKAQFSNLRIRYLIANMLAYILESKTDTNNLQLGLTEYQKKETLKLININIRKRISTKDIASHIELNSDYFSRQFKKSFGVSVSSFIKSERIRFAKHIMLESNLSVSEIAYNLGYDDIFLFSHQFKEVSGISPKKWKEKKIENL